MTWDNQQIQCVMPGCDRAGETDDGLCGSCRIKRRDSVTRAAIQEIAASPFGAKVRGDEAAAKIAALEAEVARLKTDIAYLTAEKLSLEAEVVRLEADLDFIAPC